MLARTLFGPPGDATCTETEGERMRVDRIVTSTARCSQECREFHSKKSNFPPPLIIISPNSLGGGVWSVRGDLPP